MICAQLMTVLFITMFPKLKKLGKGFVSVPNQILLMFVKDFFLKVAQKKGRTKRTHQIAGFEKMM